MAQVGGRPLTAVDSAALRLLACAASAAFLICLLVLPRGPSELNETLSWVFVFAGGLPFGLVLAAYQSRLLAAAAPSAAARGVAGGTILLALALLLRNLGVGDQVTTPSLPSRRLALWPHPSWPPASGVTRPTVRVALLASLPWPPRSLPSSLFVPDSALRAGALLPALALAIVALVILRLGARQPRSRSAGPAVDIVICVLIALLVIQLPRLAPYTLAVTENHPFFLGPANDVLHGRTVLAGTWSQYGVGLIDALALFFAVVPPGFGTFALLIVALTTALYLCVYATLRLAGLGQLLAALTIGVGIAGNLFARSTCTWGIQATRRCASASPIW